MGKHVLEQPDENIVAVLKTYMEDLEASGDKPSVSRVLPFVQALYEVECVGGSLHIVLDDGNLKDSHIQYCIDYAKEHGDKYGEYLGRVLLRMSQTQRMKLYNSPARES